MRVDLALESIEAGLRFRVTGNKGRTGVTESGEGSTTPNPVELLLAALGGCGGMDVISILRKQRQEVHGYEVVVTGERRETHPRSFTRIEVLHRLRGRDLNADGIAEAIRLSDTKYCTVHASLDPAIAVTSRFEIVPE